MEMYERTCHITQSNNTGIVLLDAPGGTSKTYLTNLILSKFRIEGKIALDIASSVIAVTLIKGGRTAHSAFKLNLNLAMFDSYVQCENHSGLGMLLKC